jgi:hypothetical protein
VLPPNPLLVVLPPKPLLVVLPPLLVVLPPKPLLVVLPPLLLAVEPLLVVLPLDDALVPMPPLEVVLVAPLDVLAPRLLPEAVVHFGLEVVVCPSSSSSHATTDEASPIARRTIVLASHRSRIPIS